MDGKTSDLLRMTAANMTELLNRVADYIEQLEYKIQLLEKQVKEQNDTLPR